MNRKHHDTFADKKNNNAPVFAEALHLYIANIENSLCYLMLKSNFLPGSQARKPPICYSIFKVPVFQEVPGSSLKILHGYTLRCGA